MHLDSDSLNHSGLVHLKSIGLTLSLALLGEIHLKPWGEVVGAAEEGDEGKKRD